MAEEVIVSAIESLECWLLKKEENNLEKLSSLIVGMSDLGEENKEMVHSLLLQFGMEEEEHEEDEDEDEDEEEDEDEDEEEEDEREINEIKLYKLLDLNKEKMYSLVVGMAEFWEDYYKEKLYHLLFRVDSLWGDDEEVWAKEELQSLVVEIADMWGDDGGELNKEKLHSLLFEMLKMENYSNEKIMRRMSGEVGGLWKDKKPKLNKEKLHTWLTNKLDLCEPEDLFRVLLDTMLYHSSHFHKLITRVEGAKGEFRMILDLITDKKLGEESSLLYFISDAVDMAHHAHFLIHLQDSHPSALFFELTPLHRQADNGYETYYECFGKKFKHMARGLQEIKVGMLGFVVERLQNDGEMEGGENVVVLEEDVNLLLYDNGNCEPTLITGMAGSGKTTLARQVYNHTSIARQFERRAWVCLSTVFSRKEMLLSLIRQLVDGNELASLERIERADYKSLKQVLRKQLLRIRYFIVLDDVSFNTTHLEYVTKALPQDNYGTHFNSRLLLTSRSTMISHKSMFSEMRYVHKMKSMDEDKSWTLLLKTLSFEGSGEEFPKPLVRKAKQILMRKSSGLPLAIKEVGRHWAKKRQSGSEWEELIESIDLTETLRVLESAYHDWDKDLKSRFLPLAFFKEGATIRAKKLEQIWRVMGVISIFSTSCLRDLHRESIIDVIDMDKEDNIKTCCVHAVFHRLSIMKAEDELNFEILSKDRNNRPSHQPHHRAIYCSREKLMNYSSNQDKHLVSLFLYGGGYFNSWDHFEQLKTLDMEDFGLKILPDVIGMLSELRYLGLRNNYIQELPHSLRRLKKLEVLDIALNFMVEVEDIIWEMDSLRHLYMTDISCQKPLRIDTLKNLETLTYVSVHNWTYEASRLKMMMNLTKLGIQEVDGNTDVSKLFASLAELESLQHLILRGFRFKSMHSLDEIGILRNLHDLKLEGLITRLPSAKNFPSIRCLSLVNSCLHEDPMPILQKIFSLTYLKLQNAYTGQQMVISCNGFSRLSVLVIEELWHLTNVQIEKGALMMELEELEINNCPNLETLPQDFFATDYMPDFMRFKINATKIRESSFVRIKIVDMFGHMHCRS